MDKPTVAILDAGSQFSKVIDRRVRELSVHSEIVALDTPIEDLAGYGAIIVSGGPGSVGNADSPTAAAGLFEMDTPILGICYGMQMMALAHGGTVEKGSVRQDGVFDVALTGESMVFGRVEDASTTRVLLTHGDCVTAPGAGVSAVAHSPEGIIAAIEVDGKPHYGLQFHPEVDLTAEGMAILGAFLFDVAGVEPSYSVSSRKDEAIAYIQGMVAGVNKKILVLVSGGVDSSVCATLVTAAVGADNVVCLHVDNGFMRKGESAMVMDALRGVGIDVQLIDGAASFYAATTEIDGVETGRLDSVVEPEAKRKIIGDTFMRVTSAKAAELGLDPDAVILAQGTLRPDLIESASKVANASGNASVIKTHHNDTALVRVLRDAGRVVEPLKEYHKDEVRKLGIELGLPVELVMRQPFPGPGLAIRILCAVEPFVPPGHDDLSAALAAVTSAVSPDGAYTTAILPVASVGVQGDGRTYASLVGVFGPEDAAGSADVDWSTVFELATAVPKRTHGVNRVAYVFGARVPDGAPELASITPTKLTPDVIAMLQEADAVVNGILAEAGLLTTLSQVPVILFPADFGVDGGRCICIRTMVTNDFMTGVPAVPGSDLMPHSVLDALVAALLALDTPPVRVVYDCTSKPPGTTEWE